MPDWFVALPVYSHLSGWSADLADDSPELRRQARVRARLRYRRSLKWPWKAMRVLRAARRAFA